MFMKRTLLMAVTDWGEDDSDIKLTETFKIRTLGSGQIGRHIANHSDTGRVRRGFGGILMGNGTEDNNL
jgi:hypothetical protein